MISQILSLVYVVIIWLTRRKNIYQNISYQHYILSHINLVPLNNPKLACCTTPLLATLDSNVQLNISRIWRYFGVSTTTYSIFHWSLSLLSENEHVDNLHPCTWFHNLDIHSNGMFKYRFHRSISGSRISPCRVELYHTIDATALSAAECLLKHFGRLGAPHPLRSDNGSHFIAHVIREFLHLICVSHCLVLAYSKNKRML